MKVRILLCQQQASVGKRKSRLPQVQVCVRSTRTRGTCQKMMEATAKLNGNESSVKNGNVKSA